MHVIEVKIREHRFVVRFKDDPPALRAKDYCLVECEGDKDFAKIKTHPYQWEDEIPPEDEVFFVRLADENDFEIVRANREIERDAYRFALDRVRERDLDMALAGVERTFDGRKMRFFFTAEQRIDFRELVKDLAAQYKTRIEMRQIGVRDRSKKIGGYGICGQELCCSRFLRKFEPITIRMAKEQNLALNPTKISGLCGRLMCCLSYEVNDYASARKEYPPNGAKVSTPWGNGVLTGFNYVKESMNVNLDDGRQVTCRRDEMVILADRGRDR